MTFSVLVSVTDTALVSETLSVELGVVGAVVTSTGELGVVGAVVTSTVELGVVGAVVTSIVKLGVVGALVTSTVALGVVPASVVCVPFVVEAVVGTSVVAEISQFIFIT